MHLRSISKLYIQDACINKRDNELGLGRSSCPPALKPRIAAVLPASLCSRMVSNTTSTSWMLPLSSPDNLTVA